VLGFRRSKDQVPEGRLIESTLRSSTTRPRPIRLGSVSEIAILRQLPRFKHRQPTANVISGAAFAGAHVGENVLVQPEMEKRRSPLVSIPPFGRGFSRHGGLSIRWKLGGARTSPHAPVHRLDEPTGISLSMVASLQCPLPFRPARSL